MNVSTTVSTLLLIFSLLLPQLASGQNEIDDPIFQIGMTRKVFNSFEIRPASFMIKMCGSLKTHPQMNFGDYRVFAELQRNDLYAAIVDNGKYRGILVSRYSKCHIEPATFVFSGKPDKVSLSDSEIEDLFFDGLKRYSSAFGNKDQFLAWLDSNMASLYQNCRGRGNPKWMCDSGYEDWLPSQLKALERFKSSSEVN